MTETTVDRRTAPGPDRAATPPSPGRRDTGPRHTEAHTGPQHTGVPAPSGDERVRAVLETARAVVDRGWLQRRWYETAPRPWRQKLFGPLPTADMLEGACLVAAVAVAGHAGGVFVRVDRDSGPSIDRLWDALGEQHGRPAEPQGAVAPAVRRARMHELVRFNDAPGRTREEVLALLDRAISRTILDQVRSPARP